MSVDCLDVIDGDSAADLAQKRQERNKIISHLETIRQLRNDLIKQPKILLWKSLLENINSQLSNDLIKNE